MLIKLIFRNVRRNLQTYTIYFLTLSIIYSLLYGFNSLMNHPVMTSMSGIRHTVATIMSQYMGLVSFTVVIAIAFLIIYATNFVLRRRRQELGLYASLGMRNSKISLIVFCETVLVNFISLVVGLFLGVVFSCLLAKMATYVFATSYSGGLLHLSVSAVKIVLLSYIMSGLLIGAMNFFKFKGKRIIALIQDEGNSQGTLSFDRRLSLFLFVLATAFLAFGFFYIATSQNISGLLILIKRWGYVVIPAFILAVFFFYYSASHILLAIAVKFEGLYFRKYNSFKCQQLAKQIDTNSITLAILSLCLTLSFAIVIIGGSSYDAMQKELGNATPFDITITHHLGDGYKYPNNNIKKMAEASGFDTSQIRDDYQFSVYNSKLTYGDIIDTKQLWSLDTELPHLSVPIIRLSDYNRLMSLQGKQAVQLAEDEFVVNANYKGTLNQIENFVKTSSKIDLNGQILRLKNRKILPHTYVITTVGNNDRGSFIVPDKVAETLKPATAYFIARYKAGISQKDQETVTRFLGQWVENYTFSRSDDKLVYEYQSQTSDRLAGMYLGLMGVVIFVMSFIGITFAIISLSILSIQSSTQALDSVKDYNILYLLGSNRKTLRKLLWQQVLSYFLVPCFVALPFSYVIGKVILIFLANFMNFEVVVNYYYVLTVFVILGLYILLTNRVCQKIIKSA